jgi:hypothetical protein
MSMDRVDERHGLFGCIRRGPVLERLLEWKSGRDEQGDGRQADAHVPPNSVAGCGTGLVR